jgi:hypothetical protein
MNVAEPCVIIDERNIYLKSIMEMGYYASLTAFLRFDFSGTEVSPMLHLRGKTEEGTDFETDPVRSVSSLADVTSFFKTLLADIELARLGLDTSRAIALALGDMQILGAFQKQLRDELYARLVEWDVSIHLAWDSFSWLRVLARIEKPGQDRCELLYVIPYETASRIVSERRRSPLKRW